MIMDIGRSIGDFTFYKEVPKKTVWATVAYLTLLGGIFSLAVVAAVHKNVRPRILEATEWAAANMPVLTLADGKLTSSSSGPVEVRHPAAPQVGVMVDTSRVEPVTPAEMAQRKLIAYMTSDAVHVLTTDRLETYPLAPTKGKESLVVDGPFYRNLAGLLLKVLYPIAFITSWGTFLIWKHVAALIYTLVGLLVNAVVDGGHEFPALYRMAVYAQTPVVAIQTAALFLPRPIPLFPILALILVTAYLWQAIRNAEPAARA